MELMRRRIILSIDGGGIRGLIPIAILKRLNDLSKYKLQEQVDLYAGTSTGALIGGALMLKTELGYIYNITDILNLYSFRSNAIFKADSNSEVNPLKFIMEKTFQNMKVSDQRHDFIFTTEDNNCGRLHTISNIDEDYNETRLSELLLACSAVKGYFDPIIINGRTLSDGVTMMKNPSLLAYEHYRAIYPNDDMILLSMGTGDVSNFYDDEIEKSVEEVDQKLNEISENNPMLKYYRIQPKLSHAKPDMDDTSQENIQNLLNDAQKFISYNPDLIDQIAFDLKKIKVDQGKSA